MLVVRLLGFFLRLLCSEKCVLLASEVAEHRVAVGRIDAVDAVEPSLGLDRLHAALGKWACDGFLGNVERDRHPGSDCRGDVLPPGKHLSHAEPLLRVT